MIEKKTMGYVDFEYPNYEAKAVSVVVNSETGNVEIYRPDEDCNEWYTPSKSEHFYPTVDEANAALKKYKQELYDKMGEVKNYLEAMCNWFDNQENDSPLHFEEGDYLPYAYRRSTDGYWKEEHDKVDKVNDYLIGIVRTGFVNIKGSSFKVEDVKRIKWGKDKAEIILKDDRKTETGNDSEFTVIQYLFGGNYSGYTYNYLALKTGSDD